MVWPILFSFSVHVNSICQKKKTTKNQQTKPKQQNPKNYQGKHLLILYI